MEMVKTKLTVILALSLLATACGPRMTWSKFVMDGHRTGVTAVAGSDYTSSLGYADSVYHAPNGKVFDCGCTPVAARLLIDAQPDMAYLKEILGYSPRELRTGYPESELGNWSVDALMKGVESATGRKVDVGFLNLGGIRVSMPEGEVLLDDIISMFPFKNHLCYVKLKGSDVRFILDYMCQKVVLAEGGARFVGRNGKAEDIMIGGEPLDDERSYGVATIDFLLDGGDNIYVARNAEELIISDVLVMDWMVPYVRSLNQSGQFVEAQKDGRFTVE